MKLTFKKAERIREMYNTGRYSQRDLGDMFDVCPTTICNIVNDKRWIEEHPLSDVYYKGHKMNLSNDGYPRVWIGNKNQRVHHMVYKEHYGDIPKDYEVHHKDGNKMNWCPENLEAVTRSEHMRKDKRSLGESNFQAKLTCTDIKEIRRRYGSGDIYQETLADEYNVTISNISKIVRRKTWKHL